MKLGFSLQARLLLLVVAALLPLALLSVWSAVREVRMATVQAQTQLKLAASLVAAHQDRTVESARNLLSAISLMPIIRTQNRELCEIYFQSLRGRFPMYANLGLVRADGEVVCHANPGAPGFNIADRAYFQQAVAQRRFVIGELTAGKSSGRRVIPFALPVVEEGQLIGVVFASLDLAHAGATLGQADLQADARVVITDRRGEVLMEYPPRDGMPASRKLVNPELLEAARALTSGAGEAPDARGERRIYAFAPSRAVGDMGFLAAVSISQRDIAQLGTTSLREDFAALALSLLAGLGGAWWIGRRSVLLPARRILEATGRIEQGQLDSRVTLRAAHPGNEFHSIASAFNRMAQSLQLRQFDLEAELGRSRSAHTVLDIVLNSMDEGVIAANAAGHILMFNHAASLLFPLENARLPPQQDWPAYFGLYAERDGPLLAPGDVSLARALHGESGRAQVFARNSLVPEGRLLQCSFRPLHGQGEVGGGLVVFADITALEKLQVGQAAQFDELRATQRRLVEAQHIGRIGNWELQLPGGPLWWSDEVYALFGVRREDFHGRLEDFLACVHPDDRAGLEAQRAAALDGGKALDAEYRIVKPSGEAAWMYELGDIRRAPDGTAIALAGVVQDITGRKLSEMALLHNERELQSYTRMLQHATNAAHAITGQQSVRGTVQEVARQAASVIGTAYAAARLFEDEDWTPAETALAAMLHNEGRAAMRLSRADLVADSGLASLGDVNGALAVVLGDGIPAVGVLILTGKLEGGFTERDEYVATELAQLGAIAIDNARLFTQISELNAGLEARIAARTSELARQEARYRTLADQAPEVVWNLDPSGSVTYMNRAWYELVGGSGDEWLGHAWRQRVHPDDLAAMAANWERSRETLLPYTGTRRILGRDGRWHTTSYRAAPVLDEQGQVAFWVGIDSDITDLKAIEQALRASNEELQAFSYSVSHDLRAPLGAIGGFSRALQHKLGDAADERAQHFLARIQAGVVKMEQLIDAMLSLAKVARAPVNFETVDLSELARGVLEEAQMQEPERKVSVRVQDGLIARGDSRLLRVVVQNLLGNAWKFTSRNADAEVEFGTRGGGVFFVRDNGAGFDMAYADKLFGAFQRLHTESEFPGTGIGLATVRRIIARHQGRVWAESQLGNGTTFFFSLSEKAPPAWLAGDEA